MAGRLYFSLVPDDGKPSTISIIGLDEEGRGDVSISICVRRTERQAEALVHELLHLQIEREGFPKYWIQGDDYMFERAGWIINYAEHFPMKPLFLRLGYSERKFLGKSEEPPDEEKQDDFDYLKARESRLLTSVGFREEVEKCIRTRVPVSLTVRQLGQSGLKSKLPPFNLLSLY